MPPGQGVNFRIASTDWASVGVIDEASFYLWLETTVLIDDIVITDFQITGDFVECNLTGATVSLTLSSMSITEVDGIGDIAGLEILDLNDNKLTFFNPSNNLPTSLTELNLSDNLMTTAGYTLSEEWATSQSNFDDRCKIYFVGNIESVDDTNLREILLSKNCNIVS